MQINSVYGVGSTGRLTQILHRALLADGESSKVLYGRGPDAEDPGVIRLCCDLYGKANSLLSRFTGIRYGGCMSATKKAISAIKQERPDAVHLQCINGNFVNIYRLVSWLNENNIPTVITLHAEFIYTANCGHAFECERWKDGCGQCPRLYKATKSLLVDRTHESFLKMQDAFSGFDENLTVVSVSPWLRKRAESSPILTGKKHRVIPNGVNTEIFCRRKGEELRKKHGIADKKIVFHATAMFRDRDGDIKGGAYVLRLAERMQDVVFVVAGKNDVRGEIPRNVILLGEIKDPVLLARYYSMADLTLLTSRRETYSMVCAESLCCGTPVSGFCAGAPEQISLPEYSSFVPQGDLNALEDCVRHMLGRRFDRLQLAEAARMQYSEERMTSEYKALYREVICGR